MANTAWITRFLDSAYALSHQKKQLILTQNSLSFSTFSTLSLSLLVLCYYIKRTRVGHPTVS